MVTSFKHNRVIAYLANRYYDLRSRRLEKLIFVATTGRSGTLTMAKLFEAVPGCMALHEPYPAMKNKVLTAASNGDNAYVDHVYRTVKSVNIRRSASGHRYYLEANHLFIKTFIKQVVEDFGDKVSIVHLVRSPLSVANSIYRLQDYPGTEEGNHWWLDYRAPTNRIRIGPILDNDPEFSHPFYKALWYWFEVEVRIAEWKEKLSEVPFIRFETEWFNDRDKTFELLRKLHIEFKEDNILKRIKKKEHRREQSKRVAGFSQEELFLKFERFKAMLARQGFRLQGLVLSTGGFIV